MGPGQREPVEAPTPTAAGRGLSGFYKGHPFSRSLTLDCDADSLLVRLSQQPLLRISKAKSLGRMAKPTRIRGRGHQNGPRRTTSSC
ncbi:uncharacterized protein LY79DRAFT_541665 [Colletotrichum navitas]|uniref:Uncharacterized protein n=1 Tax=Colletotrichum navitas TaxID=681940 RepID=A0AAD8Q7U9_9PEZI|nr:uncharacterized protein LY79DRAFT_541665 [Colletotrichum navitas]KAK1597442.1 hypothetical protein LY79DRAFT_541665 [Colletotrichum navitas]